MIELLHKLTESIKENKPAVLVTITKTKGSTPGKTGFKILADENGRIAGTIGGGPVEFYAINKCMEFIKGNEYHSYELIKLVDVEGPEIDNSIPGVTKIKLPGWCGGELELFFELFKNEKILYIFGGGHVGAEVASLASQQGYFVEIFDNRQKVLDLIPDDICKKHLIDFPPLNLNVQLKENAYVVIVTQCYRFDLPILEMMLTHSPVKKYIGMIGSKLKVKKCINYLNEKHGNKLSYENIYSPIGIDLGAETPAEIALSIMAEITAVANNRQAAHLRLKSLTQKENKIEISNEASIYN
jgi:xanthine dehydrogenase accessory factor